MSGEEKPEEKWAANIAFTGDPATVKQIIKLVESLENEGKIDDFTWIEGPHESLQLMLKRRVKNLALDVGLPKALPQSGSDMSEEDDGGE